MFNRDRLANHFAGREDPPARPKGFLKNILTERRQLKAFSPRTFFFGTKKRGAMLASFNVVETPTSPDILTEARRLKPFAGYKWLFTGVGNPTTKVASFNAKAPTPGEEYQGDDDEEEGLPTAQPTDGHGREPDDDDPRAPPSVPNRVQEVPRDNGPPNNREDVMAMEVHVAEMASAREAHENELRAVKNAHEAEIDGLRQQQLSEKTGHEAQVEELNTQLLSTKNAHEAEMDGLRQQQLSDKTAHEAQVEELKAQLLSAKNAHEAEIDGLRQQQLSFRNAHQVEVEGWMNKLVSKKSVANLRNRRLTRQLKDSQIYRKIANNEHGRKIDELEDKIVEAEDSKETAIQEMQQNVDSANKSKKHVMKEHKKATLALKELEVSHEGLQHRYDNMQQRYRELREDHEKIAKQLWSQDPEVVGANTEMAVAKSTTEGDSSHETAGLLQANKGLADMVSSLRKELDDQSIVNSDLRAELGRGDRISIYNETQEQLGRALGRVRQWQSCAKASGEINEQVFAELSLLDGDKAVLESQVAQLEEEMETKNKALAGLNNSYDYCLAQRKTDFEERAKLEQQYAVLERGRQVELESLKKEHTQTREECYKKTALAESLRCRNEALAGNLREIIDGMADGFDANKVIEIAGKYIKYSVDDVEILEGVCEQQHADYRVAEKDIQYWRNRVAEVDLDVRKIADQEQQIRELESENERIVLDMEIHGDLRKKLDDAQQLVKNTTAKLKIKDTEWAKLVADKAQGAEKHCLQYLRGRVAELTATSENARRRETKLYEEIDTLKKDVELSRRYYDVEGRFGDNPIETIESFKAERSQAITERNDAVAAAKVLEERLVAIELQRQTLTSDDMHMRHALQAIGFDEHNMRIALQTQYMDLNKRFVQLGCINGQLERELAMRVAQVEGNPGVVVRRIEELGKDLREMRVLAEQLAADKTQLVRQLGAAVLPPYECPRISELQDEVNHLTKLLTKSYEAHQELFNTVENGITSGMLGKIANLEGQVKEKEAKNKELGIKNLLLHCPRDTDFILNLDTRPKGEQTEDAPTVTHYQYEWY
ncbi:MAG: hypothetical protein M1835_000909 [Candelina submexicana]|nr:MAG: hypothetical protein M1835_000909 [Candelina submexicana]